MAHLASMRRIGLVPVVALLAACATQSRAAAKLPFHVAIAPVVCQEDSSSQLADGTPTDLALAFDAEAMTARLSAALADTCSMITRLPSATPGGTTTSNTKAWIDEAHRLGADLMLVPTLRYGPRIHTALNGQFALNIPLFAIGGPFCWFVADRSYYCSARLNARLFDVTVAVSRHRQVVDNSVRLLDDTREASSATLNFLQRADGVMPYLLSVVCPAGLLASESGSVAASLQDDVGWQLCQAMARSLQDRATEIIETELVDFFLPRDRLRVASDGGQRALVGEVVLRVGEANELGRLRYRAGTSGAFRPASLQKSAPGPVEASPGRRSLYSFRIPLDGPQAELVQVEVEQLDRFATRRSFTFVINASL